MANPQKNRVAYTYDAFGRRVRKAVPGVATSDFLYDLGGNVVNVLDGSSGNSVRAEVWLGRHFATYSGGQTYFALSDPLGTERVRTNGSGTPVNVCSSLAYGDTTSCTGTDVSPYHYAGYERDPETGLDHMLFRYYNSRTGTFMGADPLDSGNRMAYVGNDPVNGIDPMGLFKSDAVGGRCDVRDPGCKHYYLDGISVSSSIAQSLLGNGNAALCPPGASCVFHNGDDSAIVVPNNTNPQDCFISILSGGVYCKHPEPMGDAYIGRPVSDWMNWNPDLWSSFVGGFNNALDRLLHNEKCSDFFSDNGAATLMTSVIGTDSTLPASVAAVPTNSPPGLNINPNLNGAFLNIVNSFNGVSGAANIRAFFILHELGHVLGIMKAPDNQALASPTNPLPAINQRMNNNTIRANCFQ